MQFRCQQNHEYNKLTAGGDTFPSTYRRIQMNETQHHDLPPDSERPDSGTIIICSKAGPDKYRVDLSGNDPGVFYMEPVKDGHQPRFLCSPVIVTAMFRDSQSTGWGRILTLIDHDGNERRYELGVATSGKDESSIIGELRSNGVTVTSMKRHHCRLIDYLLNTESRDKRRLRSTNRSGWQEPGIYLMNDGTVIGESAEDYIIQTPSPIHQCGSKGNLESWKTFVAALCAGNSRMIFAVSTAFASIVLYHLKLEGGGYHFFGRSSDGKTTALHVASSTIGLPKEFIHTWRATDNGLEGIAKLHNDSLLILDELGELNPHDAGKCAYFLANGAGKIRSKVTGDARKKAEWLLYYLSSGEITLAEHMAEAGKQAKAGHEVRHVDIPSNAGANMGLFENIHGYENPGLFADALKHNSSEHYGHALPEFIRQFIARRQEVDEVLKTYRDQFTRTYAASNVGSQVGRVAGKFALIAAAGMLASEWGITGWEPDHVLGAVGKVFGDWLSNRSHTGNQEDVRIIQQIRGYIQQYGESRFVAARYNRSQLEPQQGSRHINQRDGFKVIKDEGNEYYVLPEAFNNICRGLNMANTLKFLNDNEYLVKGPKGRHQVSKRLPDIGQSRVYHLTAKIMNDTEDTAATEATGVEVQADQAIAPNQV